MVDSTNPRVMANNIKMLAAGGGGSQVVANPEGAATDELEKLGVGEEIYSIPTYTAPNYSTSEVNTGIKWINGSDIYRKVIDFGALPNATAKTVDSEISNLGQIVKIYGVGYTDAGYAIPLPFVDDARIAGNIMLNYESTGAIRIISGTNYSIISAYVILEYTKATES